MFLPNSQSPFSAIDASRENFDSEMAALSLKIKHIYKYLISMKVIFTTLMGKLVFYNKVNKLLLENFQYWVIIQKFDVYSRIKCH